MKHQILFGIECNHKDEKLILQSMKNYLSNFKRTTSTVKQGTSLDTRLEARLPYKIKQYHWNLNKATATYTELFPNQDLEGKYFLEQHKNYAWLILVLFHKDSPNYEENKSEKFISDMLESIGFKYKILIESDSNDRIQGDCKMN
jgi:hypothetical protein